MNGAWGSGNMLGSNTTAFLNRADFASPAAYTHGNTARIGAAGYGPSFWGQDLSLKRRFPIRESIGIQFQVDAFNAFNTTMFGTPNLNVTSSAFGHITSQANSPRAFQLSARFMF